MKSLKRFLFAAASIGLIFTGCVAQTVDLPTDEAVIAELQKIQDAKNAERSKDNPALREKLQAAGKLKKEDFASSI